MRTNPDEPIQTIEYNNNYISNGLTKREYFAAMALQGLLSDYEAISIQDYSKYAVQLADTLIEELSKTKTNEEK
jgi:hypothetical protein